MKLAREEACEILGVEEGADYSTIKRAFFSKSREWHPDKRPEEEKDEATAMFQRISAAYQKLTKSEDTDDDDDEDNEFDTEFDIIYEFFAYMQAKLDAQLAQRHRRQFAGFGSGGGSFGGSVHSSGGMGGIPIPTPFGFMYIPEESFGGGKPEPSQRYTPGRANPHQPRPPTHQSHWKNPQGSESDSSEWETDEGYSTESDGDGEWERLQERAFFRMEAEERAREQERVRAKYEAAVREARVASLRDKTWLQQLPRPARMSYTENSIVLSVDRGAKSRIADFTSGKVPDEYFWEIQHKSYPKGQQPGEWITQQVLSGVLETDIQGLDPGTKYSFRARPCKRDIVDEEEVVQCGEWSVESHYVTAGLAPKERAPAQPSKSSLQPSGQTAGRKSKPARKDKYAKSEVQNLERDQARELERIKAQEEKDAAIQAAVAAAAADYRAHAAASTCPTDQGLQGNADAKKNKKKKKKKTKQAVFVCEALATSGLQAPPSDPTSTPPGSAPTQPAAPSSTLSQGACPPPPAPPPPLRLSNGRQLGTAALHTAGTAAGHPIALSDPHYNPSEWRPVYTQDHPARPQSAGTQAAMLPPTRAPTHRGGGVGGAADARGGFGRHPWSGGEGVGSMGYKPSQAGLEAASSGSDAAGQRLAEEAARHGMTVSQYIAHQDELALQGVPFSVPTRDPMQPRQGPLLGGLPGPQSCALLTESCAPLADAVQEAIRCSLALEESREQAQGDTGACQVWEAEGPRSMPAAAAMPDSADAMASPGYQPVRHVPCNDVAQQQGVYQPKQAAAFADAGPEASSFGRGSRSSRGGRGQQQSRGSGWGLWHQEGGGTQYNPEAWPLGVQQAPSKAQTHGHSRSEDCQYMAVHGTEQLGGASNPARVGYKPWQHHHCPANESRPVNGQVAMQQGVAHAAASTHPGVKHSRGRSAPRGRYQPLPHLRGPSAKQGFHSLEAARPPHIGASQHMGASQHSVCQHPPIHCPQNGMHVQQAGRHNASQELLSAGTLPPRPANAVPAQDAAEHVQQGGWHVEGVAGGGLGQQALVPPSHPDRGAGQQQGGQLLFTEADLLREAYGFQWA